jgi:hypothetical protein
MRIFSFIWLADAAVRRGCFLSLFRAFFAEFTASTPYATGAV